MFALYKGPRVCHFSYIFIHPLSVHSKIRCIADFTKDKFLFGRQSWEKQDICLTEYV